MFEQYPPNNQVFPRRLLCVRDQQGQRAGLRWSPRLPVRQLAQRTLVQAQQHFFSVLDQEASREAESHVLRDEPARLLGIRELLAGRPPRRPEPSEEEALRGAARVQQQDGRSGVSRVLERPLAPQPVHHRGLDARLAEVHPQVPQLRQDQRHLRPIHVSAPPNPSELQVPLLLPPLQDEQEDLPVLSVCKAL